MDNTGEGVEHTHAPAKRGSRGSLRGETEEGREGRLTPANTDSASIAWASATALSRAQCRARLLEQRQQGAATLREQANQALLGRLGLALGDCRGRCVAVYWPVRGEPHLGDWPTRWWAQGTQLALPVVVGSGQPLLFAAWQPDAPLVAGAWGIAEPMHKRWVRPDVIVVPCVGFARHGFRLGYGGGFYDRTLAQLATHAAGPPLTYGVAWDDAECPDLQPLATDWRLDVIVTPAAIYRCDTGLADAAG